MLPLQIEKLGVTTVQDITRIGGKACGLVRLLRTGLPVPDAWVIPAVEVPDGETALPADIAAALDAFWTYVMEEAPGARFAVRSSAVAEDLEESSFAGIYSTVLNVASREQFHTAVLTCRAAMHGEAAKAYRDRQNTPPRADSRSRAETDSEGRQVMPEKIDKPIFSGLPSFKRRATLSSFTLPEHSEGAHSAGREIATPPRADSRSRAETPLASSGSEGRQAPPSALALIIQRMVNADCAGVLLTVNPLRPFAGEMVINAAYGLGEAVVSGLAHPDQIVLNAATGAVLERMVGAKEIEMVFSGGRGVTQDVPAERRTTLSVSDAQIQQLWAMARRVEAGIGTRQDCEWAFEGNKLFLLQQRPITGLPPGAPAQVWSRKFGDEYLAEYTMPLSNSILVPWITDVFLKDFAERFGFDHRLTHEPTLRYEGYAYISGEYMAKTLAALPRALRRPETVGWFTPLWNEQILAEPFRPTQFLRMMLTAIRDPHSSLTKNPQDLAAHTLRVEADVVPRLTQDYTALTASEWEQQYQATDGIGRAHFLVIRWGMGFHNPFLHSVLQRLLKDWCADDGSLYQTIISGLPGTHTAEINHAIWKLGQAARGSRDLADAMRAGTTVKELRARFPEAPFWQLFQEFMRKYGHRGESREIARPRWLETPDVILGLVRVQLSGEHAADPAGVEKKTWSRRQAAEADAMRRAGGMVRRSVLRRVIALTQTYTLYRENQRFHLDYILSHARYLVLEAGRRLQAAGILQEVADVFYLEGHEFAAVRKSLRAEPALAAAIEDRKRHFAVWRDRLPATYLFDGVQTEGEVAEGSGAVVEGERQGTPASRGIAVGNARVITSLAALGEVRAGEILVAGNTDPGWTSVFPLLAGLITETGGILSHGALLAREYGIPAVTGVKGILQRVKTGDRIQIDGGTGSVQIL